MKDLTEKQRTVLAFIAEYIAHNGRAPSYNDIASHFGFSAKAAYDTVLALIKKGKLEKSSRLLRSISLPEDERMRMGTLAVPFFSREPSPEDIREKRCNGFSFIEGRYADIDCFAFRVTSSSMTDAAIIPGDTAIIAVRKPAQDGDIVLAYCPGNDRAPELRRLRKIPGFFLLIPDNASMGTIKTTDAEILGVLIGIRREI